MSEVSRSGENQWATSKPPYEMLDAFGFRSINKVTAVLFLVRLRVRLVSIVRLE
jgi:hypothetical protein